MLSKDDFDRNRRVPVGDAADFPGYILKAGARIRQADYVKERNRVFIVFGKPLNALIGIA